MLTLVALLLRSMSGRADDNDHDIHSWMFQVADGQLLGLTDDGKERADEASDDELNPRSLVSGAATCASWFDQPPWHLGRPERHNQVAVGLLSQPAI